MRKYSIFLIFLVFLSFVGVFVVEVSGFDVDLTEFVELDGGSNHVDALSPVCCWWSIDRDEDSWLYYDYGEDAIHNYILELKWNYTSTTANAIGVFGCMANVVDDVIYMYNNHIDTIFLLTYTYPLQFRIYEYYDGTNYNSVVFYPSKDTDYWVRVLRYGTAYSVEIYNDAGFSSLNCYDNLTLHSDYSFRYFFMVNGYNTGTGGYAQSNWADNVVFGSCDVPDVSSCDYVSSGYNSTELVSSCNFTSLWSTNGTLSYYKFCWNFTGSFVNTSSINFESGSVFANYTVSLGSDISMFGDYLVFGTYACGNYGFENFTGWDGFVLTYSGVGGYDEDDLDDSFILGGFVAVVVAGGAFVVFVVNLNRRKRYK